MTKLKATKLNPNLDSYSKIDKGKYIIDVEPDVTITTTKRQLDEQEGLEEDKGLFHL